MLIKHAYLPEELIASKREIVVNRESPLIVIPNSHLSFLNNTIRSVLNHYGYAFEEKKSNRQ